MTACIEKQNRNFVNLVLEQALKHVQISCEEDQKTTVHIVAASRQSPDIFSLLFITPSRPDCLH
jgi:hypothetical protein